MTDNNIFEELIEVQNLLASDNPDDRATVEILDKAYNNKLAKLENKEIHEKEKRREQSQKIREEHRKNKYFGRR